MPIYERISAVVSVTLIGLALYFVLDFPAQALEFSLFGSPLSLGSTYRGLMVLLLGGLAMVGMDTILRLHPALPSRHLAYMATFWTLPGLLIILATQTLGLSPTPLIWAVSLAVVGLLLWLTMVAQYHALTREPREPREHSRRLWPRLWQQFIGYTIALIFFILIYHSRSRSAISATAVMLVGSAVALPILRRSPGRLSETWLLAFVVGLSLGQLTWALNYWRTGALNAGLLLFLALYVLIGIAQQHLQGSLSRQTAWEFGLISAAGLLIIFNI